MQIKEEKMLPVNNYTHQCNRDRIIHLRQLWLKHLARVTADEKAKGGWTEPK